MIEKNNSFSMFGKSFQEKLCQLILADRVFADRIGEVIDYNFLELRYLQVFCKIIYNYREKYGTHPNHNVITSILRSSLEKESEANQKMIRDYFGRILATPIVPEEDYIKDTAVDFCRKQKLKDAIGKSIDLLENTNHSFDQISDLINNAMKLGSENDSGYDYIKDFEQRFEVKSRNPVATGWDILNDNMAGGAGKGEMGVVIAPTGAGKSMVLVHIGAAALKAGKTVVHYSLELDSEVIATRYDSCITGISLNEHKDNKKEILENIKDLDGQLLIKYYPTKTATIKTISNHLERLKQFGVEIDLIIVDYADLIRPPDSGFSEKRHQLEGIYEDLRGIAGIHECPIWTASQSNRSGVNAEIVTMEAISEAFNKCFVADFIMTLSRTIDDRCANTGRIFIAKNRNGPDGLIYNIFMDTSKVEIKILDSSSGTMEDFRAKSLEKARKDLLEKYKINKKDSI